MTSSRLRTKRFTQFCPAISLLAVCISLRAPAAAQGEDEVFHYLIPLAEAVSLSESGVHDQAIRKTTKILADLSSKKATASKVTNPLPVLRGDTGCGDVYKQVQAEALALKGLSNFTLKRTPQAIADLQQASALCPEHAYVLSELGSVLVKSKKHKEGIAALTRAIKLNPDIRDAYFMRATAYQQIGRLKEAKLDWARAQKIYSQQQKTIDSLTERSEKLAKENKLSEALDVDRQLIRIAPRDGLAVSGYADHLAADGKNKEALKYINAAIALDPASGYPYRVRSVIYSHLQNPEAELEDANIAFSKEPRSLEALNSRAIANLDADQPVQAIRDFDLFVKRNPDFADAYINRSTAYLRIGEFAKAVRDGKHAVALVPASPYSYQCLGAALRRAGPLKEARDALETSLRYTKTASTDSVAMAQFNLGAVLLDLKDPKWMEHVDAAVKLAPNLPDIFLQRGVYNASLGDTDEAIRILTRQMTRRSGTPRVSKLVRPKPSSSKLDSAFKLDVAKTNSSKTLNNKTKTNRTITEKGHVQSGGARRNPKVPKMPAPGPVQFIASTTKPAIPHTTSVPRKIEISILDLKDCMLICNRIIENSPAKSETYYTRGLANLCLKQYDAAASDFRKLADTTKSVATKQRALVLAYLSLERCGKPKDAKEFLESASTTGGSTPLQSLPELKFFRGEITEPELFTSKLSKSDLTRIHSYLAFHFKAIADNAKGKVHARWVLDYGNVASPELVLTAADNNTDK